MYQKNGKERYQQSKKTLDITINIATAAASRNPRKVLSTLAEVINFYHTSVGVDLGIFVKFILIKWNKKQTDYTHQHQLKIKILT